MAAQFLSSNSKPEYGRRYAEFHPTVLGNHFTSLGGSEAFKFDQRIEKEVEILKEEVRKMLIATPETPSHKLNLINSIQQLGVADHFQSEIQDLLDQVNNTYADSIADPNHNDLKYDALLFRLLRQQGYKVSSDIFKKYIDHEGKFMECLAKDVHGLLSLYEASYFSVYGEDILDEALNFTSKNLEATLGQLNYPLSEEVSYALKHPLRRGVPRLEVVHYISIYKENSSHSSALLKLAKVDYNVFQKLFREELGEVSRWWKDSNFSGMLPFARDRITECYLWALIIRPEPQHSAVRRFFAKVIQMASILDDIYDVHGTLEEVKLLTDSIDRWNMSTQDKLPDYLKFYYRNMLRLYVDYGRDQGIETESFAMLRAKDGMKKQAKAYMGEANWLHAGYIPTIDEYYEFALPSSCCRLFSVTIYLCMGDAIPKEAFDWIFTQPKILRGAEIIGRLMNDLRSHKFEQARPHIASAVECYIKQYDVSEEEAYKALQKQVDDAWKDINECCLKPTEFPMALLSPIVNIAKVTHITYREEDGYTSCAGTTKLYITSLMINPISL